MPPTTATTFGDLLKQLRKRAGMTQGDLAAAVGYSVSFICALEQNRRLPDIEAVVQTYLPALGLQDEPRLATQLVEQAALARGEKPPATFTIKRERRLLVAAEIAQGGQHLPLPPTPLLGRAPLVQQLCNRLQGHSGRLLTLIGPPGVGKTRLALAVAGALQASYQDGACFVSLAAVSDPSLVATTLINAFNLHEISSKPPQSRLMEYLRRKELLLVLDNFEQIIAAAPLVAEVLAHCSNVRILVTSRERLHLRAEQRYKVPPLDLAPAVELFMQHAQVIASDLPITPQDRLTIESICTWLDCLPLAIELCAAQSELFAPAQLLAALHAQPLNLLVNGASDLPPQQRTLRQAIQSSYHSLSLPAQALFRALGLFVGGFDLQAVAHLGFQSTVLQSLIHKSLVADSLVSPLIEEERRFLLLETIRAFALEQLVIAGEVAAVQQTFFAYFLAFAEQAAQAQATPARQLWLTRLSQERDNLRMALQVGVEQNMPAAKLFNQLYWFWYHLGLVEEGRQWAGRILAQSATTASPALHAATLLTAGKLAEIQGDWRSALAYFQASMTHYQALDDAENYVKAQADYSEALLDTGEILPARTTIQAALDKVRDWPLTKARHAMLAHVFYVYARVLLRMDEIDAARGQLAQSLDHYQQAEDRSGYAYALYTIAQLDMRQERFDAARVKYTESLAIFSEYESHLLAACSYYFLGYLDRVEGFDQSALHNFVNGLKLFMRMGNVGSIVGTITEIAKVTTRQQQYADACRLFGKADFLRQSIGETQWKALPAERQEYEQYLALLRLNLSPTVFDALWQEGQQMETTALLSYITEFKVTA